jgi:hypothetical protein
LCETNRFLTMSDGIFPHKVSAKVCAPDFQKTNVFIDGRVEKDSTVESF